MKLKDKVVLVTGGAQGIGKEICLTCAREGAKIIVNYVNFGDNKKIAEATKSELEAIGATVMLAQANVASFEETETMFKEIIKEFGRIDVLVNNAGITKDKLLSRMSVEDFNDVIATNLVGTFSMTKYAMKIMQKQRSGNIVNISSISGTHGNVGQANYSASKAGIIGMTMSLAREVGSRGITVNAVAPGFIQTAMTDVLPEDIKESMAKQIPLGTFGQVRDIANTVVFLASDDARYITGQTIHVDGGMAM